MEKKIELTEDLKPEFIGQIVDKFEDYLAENEIGLQNADREEAIKSGDIESDGAAIIYGDHYDMIGDTVSRAIEDYNLMDEAFINAGAQEDAINTIVNAFYAVLETGKYDDIEGIPSADVESWKDGIRDTIRKWGLAPVN